MKRFIAIFVFLLTVFAGLQGQAQNADAVIDKREILIGEQAVISLSYRFDKTNPVAVQFPQIGDTLVKNIEVLEKSSIDTLATGAGVKESRLEQKLLITSFDTGVYTIPAFEYNINGNIQTTDPLQLRVSTVPIDTTAGIMGDKGLYLVDAGLGDYIKVFWPYAAGGLAIIAIIILAIFLIRRYLKKRREQPAPEPVKPALPPHVIALEELERIRQEKIYITGKTKEYHTAITDVLRDFLERAYDTPAHELTTKQIMDRLRYSGIEERETMRLRTILFRADMVKFAKENPEARENEEAIVEAKVFVENTAPKPKLENQEPKNE